MIVCCTRGPCGPAAPEPPDSEGGLSWRYAGSYVRDDAEGRPYLVTRWERPEVPPVWPASYWADIGKFTPSDLTQETRDRRLRALALLQRKS